MMKLSRLELHTKADCQTTVTAQLACCSLSRVIDSSLLHQKWVIETTWDRWGQIEISCKMLFESFWGEKLIAYGNYSPIVLRSQHGCILASLQKLVGGRMRARVKTYALHTCTFFGGLQWEKACRCSNSIRMRLDTLDLCLLRAGVLVLVRTADMLPGAQNYHFRGETEKQKVVGWAKGERIGAKEVHQARGWRYNG